MSGGTSPDPTEFSQWMRGVNRRLTTLETRPTATSALDLLGPGIDSTAMLVADWNDDTAFYNGMYYSEIGVLNGPDLIHRWVGTTTIDSTGSGYQLLVAVPATTDSAGTIAAWTHLRKHRIFNTPSTATRVYSSWATA